MARVGAPGAPLTRAVSTVLVVLLALGVWWLQSRDGGEDRSRGVDAHGIAWVALADLPPEAAETMRLIDAGGPFPHPGKDGSTFGNFEGLLPDRERGYYLEYTVPTPGVPHRGARRIVAGDGGERYWTEDHYASFERIRR